MAASTRTHAPISVMKRPRRSRRCNDKFAWNPKAIADPPIADRVHIVSADSCPNLITEARPGERNGATHKRCVTGVGCIGKVQGCRDATVFDCLEPSVST